MATVALPLEEDHGDTTTVAMQDIRDTVIQAVTFSEQNAYSNTAEEFDPDVLQFLFVGEEGWAGAVQGTTGFGGSSMIPGTGSTLTGYGSPTSTHYGVSSPWSSSSGSATVAIPSGTAVLAVGDRRTQRIDGSKEAQVFPVRDLFHCTQCSLQAKALVCIKLLPIPDSIFRRGIRHGWSMSTGPATTHITTAAMELLRQRTSLDAPPEFVWSGFCANDFCQEANLSLFVHTTSKGFHICLILGRYIALSNSSGRSKIPAGIRSQQSYFYEKVHDGDFPVTICVVIVAFGPSPVIFDIPTVNPH